MKTLPPTARQAEVLRLFGNAAGAGKSAPTVREICSVLGIVSTKGATDHILALSKKGLLRQGAEKQARSWTLTAAGWSALSGIDTLSIDLRGALVAFEEAERRTAPPFELAEILEDLAVKATDGAARYRARYSPTKRTAR